MAFTKEKIKAVGVILAGGRSSRMAGRMGAPKALLEVGGIPIVLREVQALREVFDEVLIVAKDPAPYEGLGLKAIPDADRFRGVAGPLTGLYTALREIEHGYAFVAACDMPFIEPGLVRWLTGLARGDNLVIPEVDGLIEPLFALYPRSSLPAFEAALERGVKRLRDVFGELEVSYADGGGMRVHDPELLSLINVNTPDDLARAENLLRTPLASSSKGYGR